VPQQELDGAQILRAPVNQGSLGTSQGVRSISGGIQADLPHPAMHDTGVLRCGKMRRAVQATWEQEVVRFEALLPDTRGRSLSRLFCNLKLYGTLCLLLHDDRPCSDPLSVRQISDPQFHQIARPQLAVDGQVEECQIAHAVGELQADPNRPDLLQA
jgi:hypothetical protein